MLIYTGRPLLGIQSFNAFPGMLCFKSIIPLFSNTWQDGAARVIAGIFTERA
jgi:hypothetical protein